MCTIHTADKNNVFLSPHTIPDVYDIVNTPCQHFDRYWCQDLDSTRARVLIDTPARFVIKLLPNTPARYLTMYYHYISI